MTLNIIGAAISVVSIIVFVYTIYSICCYRCCMMIINRIHPENIEAMELEPIHTAMNTRTENAEETND